MVLLTELSPDVLFKSLMEKVITIVKDNVNNLTGRYILDVNFCFSLPSGDLRIWERTAFK